MYKLAVLQIARHTEYSRINFIAFGKVVVDPIDRSFVLVIICVAVGVLSLTWKVAYLTMKFA